MPPGSLIYVGKRAGHGSRMQLIDYSSDTIEEESIESVEEILPYIDKTTVTWLNVEGLGDVDLIASIGYALNIHPLVLEDILNTHQRPRFEEFDNYLYMVLKKLALEGEGFSVGYEQISILVLDNFVVTFKEKPDDTFTPLKERLENGKGRLRSLGSDYLAYGILDSIVDQGFAILDSLDEIVESTEEKLLGNPSTDTLVTIQRLKRELIHMRKSVSPLREMLAAIVRTDSVLIQEKTNIYFRDVYDHVLRIHESIDSHRDMLSSLLDIYISSVNNRMNEVMKVLTVFASIFIPLTFIAGIYGMNFEYMPELKWKWAYPTLWTSFVIIPVVLIIYFRRKKWL